MKQKFLFLLMMIFSLIVNISGQTQSKLQNPKSVSLEKENVTYFFYKDKKYPVRNYLAYSKIGKEKYAKSFDSIVYINTVNRTSFNNYLLRRRDYKTDNVLTNGFVVNLVQDKNMKKEIPLKFNYVFFLYFLLFSFIIYLINNNKKIGKINFSLKSDQELPLFKIQMFWLFGFILLSSNEKYIFNSFYGVLKQVKWINWVFDTHLLFAFIFSLILMIIYYLILELFKMIFNSNKSILKDRIQIILLVSFIYSLFVGIMTNEIFLNRELAGDDYFNFKYNLQSILYNLLLFLGIYFLYFLIETAFNYIFRKSIMREKKRKEKKKLKEEIVKNHEKISSYKDKIKEIDKKLKKTESLYTSYLHTKREVDKYINDYNEEKQRRIEEIQELEKENEKIEEKISSLQDEIENI